MKYIFTRGYRKNQFCSMVHSGLRPLRTFRIAIFEMGSNNHLKVLLALVLAVGRHQPAVRSGQHQPHSHQGYTRLPRSGIHIPLPQPKHPNSPLIRTKSIQWDGPGRQWASPLTDENRIRQGACRGTRTNYPGFLPLGRIEAVEEMKPVGGIHEFILQCSMG
jgi:hypothetical protein